MALVQTFSPSQPPSNSGGGLQSIGTIMSLFPQTRAIGMGLGALGSMQQAQGGGGGSPQGSSVPNPFNNSAMQRRQMMAGQDNKAILEQSLAEIDNDPYMSNEQKVKMKTPLELALGEEYV